LSSGLSHTSGYVHSNSASSTSNLLRENQDRETATDCGESTHQFGGTLFGHAVSYLVS
jgi:hypothetical protein